MNNYIVREPSAKIREVAREALRGNWGKVFVGMLICYLIGDFASNVLSALFYTVRYIDVFGATLPVAISYAGYLYSALITGSLMCGYAMFMLTFFRKKEISYGLTLEGFGMFGKAFCLYILYVVKIWLWGLLFVIPGIIAAFRYSQCFFIRVDNPDFTASQCIKESCRLMTGNKGKLFCLYLSFFGWAFLAAIPQTIIQDLIFSPTGIMGVVWLSILSLPSIFVTVYLETAGTAFYELLTGNLVILNPQGIPYSQTNYGPWNEANGGNQGYQQNRNDSDREENRRE